MIRFLLLVNKQGQTRLAHYYGNHQSPAERTVLEGGLIRRCLARPEDSCSSLTFHGYRVIFRRYASLYFIIGLFANDRSLVSSQNKLL